MQSIIRELWKSKMKNNIEEINKFVDTYNLLKFSKKNINNLNRSQQDWNSNSLPTKKL